MEKLKYTIGVYGCDDSTEFEIELTSMQYDIVKQLADKCTATSTCRCQPTMDIELIKE